MPNYLGMKAACRISQKSRNKFTEDDLCQHSLASTGLVKKFLIRSGLKQEVCEICGWAEKRECDGKIPIELHHINGDNSDNRIQNLQILCPNCHALTPTYSGKNKVNKVRRTKKQERQQFYTEPKYICVVCGKLGYGVRYCSVDCAHIDQRKVLNRPTKELLTEQIEKYSWTALGRMYGISDNGVRKWARAYELI